MRPSSRNRLPSSAPAPDRPSAQLSSSTLSAGFRHAATLGAWTLTADAEIAWTAPTVQPGLLRALSPIVSSTARLSASRMLGLDRLTLAVTQPLRRGTGHGHLPGCPRPWTARTRSSTTP